MDRRGPRLSAAAVPARVADLQSRRAAQSHFLSPHSPLPHHERQPPVVPPTCCCSLRTDRSKRDPKSSRRSNLMNSRCLRETGSTNGSIQLTPSHSLLNVRRPNQRARSRCEIPKNHCSRATRHHSSRRRANLRRHVAQTWVPAPTPASPQIPAPQKGSCEKSLLLAWGQNLFCQSKLKR